MKAGYPDEPKHRSKKNTKKWCKGKIGLEHDPEIKPSSMYNYWKTSDPERPACRKPTWVGWHREWMCWHVRACRRCGKILDPFLSKEECPDFPKST
jgi:hypothetical protein